MQADGCVPRSLHRRQQPNRYGVVGVAGTTDRVAEGYEGGGGPRPRVYRPVPGVWRAFAGRGVLTGGGLGGVPVGRGAIMAGRRQVADPR
jgi:hypothetical protein